MVRFLAAVHIRYLQPAHWRVCVTQHTLRSVLARGWDGPLEPDRGSAAEPSLVPPETGPFLPLLLGTLIDSFECRSCPSALAATLFKHFATTPALPQVRSLVRLPEQPGTLALCRQSYAGDS